MGRAIKRVPLDFDFPLDKTWTGYLTPDHLTDELPCPAGCTGGYSWQYTALHDLWYGKRPFDPAMTGSVPLTADTPAVREFAERNVNRAPDFYGTGERAIQREGRRLADMWNRRWCHHLSQADVDALLDDDRLWDFTREVVPGKGWVKRENPVRPTAAQVNAWSINGFGHDTINAYVVIKARCERYCMPVTCSGCDGQGSLERYEGQRAECEAWECTEPPEGPGWQLWQTVTEGGPISPVFETAEALAAWMSSPSYTWGVNRNGQPSYEQALAFVNAGWAPSFVATLEAGLVPGVEFVGSQQPSN